MKDIFELIEQADRELKDSNELPKDVIEQIKSKVSNSRYIGLAQLNPKVGDLEYNAKKISRYMDFANKIGLESVVFPELSLTGYPLEDIISRHPILVSENIKWLNGLAKKSGETLVFVGFIESSAEDGKKQYYNSIAVLQNGKIHEIIRKSKISEFPVTNDDKYFSSDSQNIFENLYCGYGVTVGDDYLLMEDEMDKKEELPKVLINCSAQVSDIKKEHVKNGIFSYLSSKYKIPLIYVNQVGANDCYIFDGISCAYNKEGQLMARAKAFEEQFLIVNPDKNIGKIYPLPQGFDELSKNTKTFSLDYNNDLERTYKALIQGVKDYFSKCGLKRAVLGLSGGLDSTVCAVILADAIGKENVFGISMPSNITSQESKSDAEQLADNLGIHFAEAPIGDMVNVTKTSFNKLFEQVESDWNYRYKNSFTLDNIQARSRAMYLWGVSNEFSSCIPIATSDKSEAYMGYATINGDMSGGFAPIADVTKTKLFALARWMNKNREEKNAIPESIIKKRPGAELAIDPKTNKPLIAEDALMPYEFLDEIIWRIENNQESYNELLKEEFLYEKNHKITKEQKVEWLDKFYYRMSRAFYKWSIMPPSIKFEPHSINGSDYRQLITSSGINYKGVSEDYITESLK